MTDASKPTDKEITEAVNEFHNAQAAWTKLGQQTPENTARFHASIKALDALRARNGGQYVSATYNED